MTGDYTLKWHVDDTTGWPYSTPLFTASIINMFGPGKDRLVVTYMQLAYFIYVVSIFL